MQTCGWWCLERNVELPKTNFWKIKHKSLDVFRILRHRYLTSRRCSFNCLLILLYFRVFPFAATPTVWEATFSILTRQLILERRWVTRARKTNIQLLAFMAERSVIIKITSIFLLNVNEVQDSSLCKLMSLVNEWK